MGLLHLFSLHFFLLQASYPKGNGFSFRLEARAAETLVSNLRSSGTSDVRSELHGFAISIQQRYMALIGLSQRRKLEQEICTRGGSLALPRKKSSVH